MEQQSLNQEYQKQQVQQRMQKVQQQCKAKLEEVHNGYTQVTVMLISIVPGWYKIVIIDV
jgi:hypothetical protein